MNTLTIVTLTVLSTNFALAQTKPRPLGTPSDSISTEKIKITPQLDVSKSVQMETSKELRSTGGGNGGFISQMREASLLASHPLTAEELRGILALDGKEIKDQLIYPLINSVSPADINDKKVSVMWKAMLENVVSLKENVRYTRMEEGNCPAGYDLCTDNKPYSTIYFDVNKIVKNKTSIAELGGIIMHEFAHHYLGENADHPDYALANWFKTRIGSGRPILKTFSLEQTFIDLGNGEYSGFYINDTGKSFELAAADIFCESKGFSKAHNYSAASPSYLLKFGFNITKFYMISKTGISSRPYLYNHVKFRAHSDLVATEVACK